MSWGDRNGRKSGRSRERTQPPQLKLAVQRVISLTALYGSMGAVLFLSAGRLDWLDAWLFLLAYYLVAVIGQLWILRNDPDLFSERTGWGENTKSWDRVIVSINLVLTIALLVLTALDAGRFGWSRVPVWLRLLALLGFIPAFGLPLWASHVNTFLASTVRIQEERGQVVIREGPYRFVRHPMYLGMVFFDLSLPLMLGSWWGLLVSALMIALVIVRAALEDATLKKELPGYADYARQVRYRLFPGVW